MIHGVGMDIVEIERIREDIKRYGDSFMKRILGETEQKVFAARANREQFLAGRFACKEAVIKALGYRLKNRPPYTDLEIVNDDTGQPVLQLPENIQQQLGSAKVLISISHENNYAAAVAIITEDR
ncbi:MAG: holo-ACP synthase [candidate division Zixibacteria bacterium]|nr:holo-ACP synthase [candidate division Zixibacteria bacterium]